MHVISTYSFFILVKRINKENSFLIFILAISAFHAPKWCIQIIIGYIHDVPLNVSLSSLQSKHKSPFKPYFCIKNHIFDSILSYKNDGTNGFRLRIVESPSEDPDSILRALYIYFSRLDIFVPSSSWLRAILLLLIWIICLSRNN